MEPRCEPSSDSKLHLITQPFCHPTTGSGHRITLLWRSWLDQDAPSSAEEAFAGSSGFWGLMTLDKFHVFLGLTFSMCEMEVQD